jgi:hypothetical protein
MDYVTIMCTNELCGLDIMGNTIKIRAFSLIDHNYEIINVLHGKWKEPSANLYN